MIRARVLMTQKQTLYECAHRFCRPRLGWDTSKVAVSCEPWRVGAFRILTEHRSSRHRHLDFEPHISAAGRKTG